MKRQENRVEKRWRFFYQENKTLNVVVEADLNEKSEEKFFAKLGY